jgi:DNA-binding transcriptional ArsR family regulator
LGGAQELAKKQPLPELLESLSQGVQIEEFLQVEQVVFVPSFWSTPLVFYSKIGESAMAATFGVRPANASIIPGEGVPDALLLALKALADPTRLRILRYLTHQPLSPAQLSRRLRLRAPTVTHHLKALRLAGLVNLTVDVKDEGRYMARIEAIGELQSHLEEFLEGSKQGDPEINDAE